MNFTSPCENLSRYMQAYTLCWLVLQNIVNQTKSTVSLKNLDFIVLLSELCQLCDWLLLIHWCTHIGTMVYNAMVSLCSYVKCNDVD